VAAVNETDSPYAPPAPLMMAASVVTGMAIAADIAIKTATVEVAPRTCWILIFLTIRVSNMFRAFLDIAVSSCRGSATATASGNRHLGLSPFRGAAGEPASVPHLSRVSAIERRREMTIERGRSLHCRRRTAIAAASEIDVALFPGEIGLIWRALSSERSFGYPRTTRARSAISMIRSGSIAGSHFSPMRREDGFLYRLRNIQARWVSWPRAGGDGAGYGASPRRGACDRDSVSK
jgi:hypothetical protein